MCLGSATHGLSVSLRYLQVLSECCYRAQNKVKKSGIRRFPRILVVQLKRFDSVNAKVTTKVNFPVCGLDLSPFSR